MYRALNVVGFVLFVGYMLLGIYGLLEFVGYLLARM